MQKGKFKVDEFIRQHNYICYCEAIIHPNGEIEYAIPSHTMKMEEITLSLTGMTHEELNNAIPIYDSPLQWMINRTGCIALWYDGAIIPENTNITDKQREVIKLLYKNKIISIGE